MHELFCSMAQVQCQYMVATYRYGWKEKQQEGVLLCMCLQGAIEVLNMEW